MVRNPSTEISLSDQQWIDDENDEFGEAFDGLGWTGKDLIEHLAEGLTYMSTQLQYGSINLKADNEGQLAAFGESLMVLVNRNNNKQDQCQKPQKNFFLTVQWLANSCQLEVPTFSVGIVYGHNDEELPEPDLEPGEIWEDSEYGSDQEQDLFGDEDSGPPNLSDEEIRDLDRKAMVTEIDRLIAMQAVQRTALSEIEKEEKTGTSKEQNSMRIPKGIR
ncbi:hypothetical protein AK812_SmicGene7446 [Symbiodinium microadriaticum]|uniref:Uncharacterized protein n=1 Tax=Symbiodinium microadriaticum TaxID=2951 RepID=A0A1Q9ENP9_SYMMI|nr:hypothetical protein AK812_SmicGene7446 [Symbiodinium microadriaticum]